MSKDQEAVRRPPLGFTFYVSHLRYYVSRVLWLLAGLAVVVLAMRFAMRALGVRDDIPFPGLIYAATAPVVQPFYRFFPVSPRFDYQAIELASLAAAGVVFALAAGVYAVGLVLRRET